MIQPTAKRQGGQLVSEGCCPIDGAKNPPANSNKKREKEKGYKN